MAAPSKTTVPILDSVEMETAEGRITLKLDYAAFARLEEAFAITEVDVLRMYIEGIPVKQIPVFVACLGHLDSVDAAAAMLATSRPAYVRECVNDALFHALAIDPTSPLPAEALDAEEDDPGSASPGTSESASPGPSD